MRARPERYIRDAADRLEHDPNLRLRPNVADDAPAPHVCKCGKSKPKRADAKPLSNERAATDALRARMRDLWRNVPGPGDVE